MTQRIIQEHNISFPYQSTVLRGIICIPEYLSQSILANNSKYRFGHSRMQMVDISISKILNYTQFHLSS